MLLIDDDARALAARAGQPRAARRAGHVRLLARDATRLGPARQPYDLVFLDPPYRSGLATPALAALRQGWLAAGARLVVETDAREALDLPPGYALEQERRYGAARFAFLRAAAG